MTSHQISSVAVQLLELCQKTILDNKENRPKIVGRDKSEQINSENSTET